MARKPTPAREHMAVARDAGFNRLSPISTIAGTLTGYGAFAIFAAIIGAVYAAADVDTDFSTDYWAGDTVASGAATAVSLLLAYLFGGYVAGRMARRAGMLHGVAVLILSLLIGAAIGGLVSAIGDDADIDRNLRSIGVPTTGDDWGNVGIATAIGSLALMAIGAIVGGMLGERWHTKLAKRAADPNYGPEAEARARQERAEAEREQHIENDDLVRRDRDVMSRDDDAREIRARQEREQASQQQQHDVEQHQAQQRQQQPEVLDMRDSSTAPAGGADSDEQRYTASEWTEMQRQQAGPGRT